MPAPTVTMVAPSTFVGIIASTPSGSTYQPDQFGYVQVQYADVTVLASLGFKIVAQRDNLSAAVDPGPASDSTQDFQVGSRWVNSTNGRRFSALSVTPGAAVWAPGDGVLGQLLSANFNSTADQPIALLLPPGAHFRINKITVTNASISLTTAAGGVYDTAAKGGNAIVAAGQSYAALTAANRCLDLPIAANLRSGPNGALFLSLTTAQGAAATADVYAFGDILAQ